MSFIPLAIYPRRKFEYFSLTAKRVQFYHSYISHDTLGREGITKLMQTIGQAYNSLFFLHIFQYLTLKCGCEVQQKACIWNMLCLMQDKLSR